MARGVKFKAKLHDPKTATRKQLLNQVQEITKFLVLMAEDFEERLTTIYPHSRMIIELVGISKAQRDAWNNNEIEKWSKLGKECKKLAKKILNNIVKTLEGIDILISEETLTMQLLNLDVASLERLKAMDIHEYEVEEYELDRLFNIAKGKIVERKKDIREEIEYEAKLIAIHNKLKELIEGQKEIILRLKYYIIQENKTLKYFCENTKNKFVPSERESRENYLTKMVKQINDHLIQEKKDFYDPFNEFARQDVTPIDRLSRLIMEKPKIDMDDIMAVKSGFTEPNEIEMLVSAIKSNPGAFTKEVIDSVGKLWRTAKKEMRDMKRKAEYDRLMNIKNRISFEDEFIEKILEKGVIFSLIIIDIDHFKNFNDTYGHDVGDKVLAEVAWVLKTALKREKDNLYRIGGEEIAVLLPNTKLEGAITTAENLRKAVEEHRVQHDGEALKVTISAGVISLEDYSGADELGLDINQIKKKAIKQADVNLYKAKKAGRNNVQSSLFDPLGPG